MSTKDGSASEVWVVGIGGGLSNSIVYNYNGAVRPVIKLSKTVLGDEEESIVDSDTDEQNTVSKTDSNSYDRENKIDKKKNEDDTINEVKSTVKVDNTYMSKAVIIIVLGFIAASMSVFIFYKIVNNKVKK